jgi:hypothetical protein
MDKSYQFAFSLCNNDLILIADKKGEKDSLLRGYYKGTDRSNGSISMEAHDRSWFRTKIGVQNIGTFKKLQVDVLGEVFEVKREPRHGLAESAD